MLVIKNLTKKFGDKKVLDNVSLQVKAGQIAFLLGSSGVGKSTLLRVLNSLEVPDSGSIELGGQPISLSSGHSDNIGMVFQQWNLFDHLTVLENITLALIQVKRLTKQQAEKEAIKFLEHYGLSDKSKAYPSHLSGGQKQRLALARALVLQPSVICLDEPTSALDPLLTVHVARAIQQLAQEGYIILVTSHDVSLLKRLECTIYLMHNGSIIESATIQQLKQTPEQHPALANFIEGQEHSYEKNNS